MIAKTEVLFQLNYKSRQKGGCINRVECLQYLGRVPPNVGPIELEATVGSAVHTVEQNDVKFMGFGVKALTVSNRDRVCERSWEEPEFIQVIGFSTRLVELTTHKHRSQLSLLVGEALARER